MMTLMMMVVVVVTLMMMMGRGGFCRRDFEEARHGTARQAGKQAARRLLAASEGSKVLKERRRLWPWTL